MKFLSSISYIKQRKYSISISSVFILLTSYSMVTKQYLLVLQFSYIAKGKVRYKSYTADMLRKWIKIS